MRPAGGQVRVEDSDAQPIRLEVDEVREHDRRGDTHGRQERPRRAAYETTTSGGLTSPLTWA
jgi:hypothetical protein